MKQQQLSEHRKIIFIVLTFISALLIMVMFTLPRAGLTIVGILPVILLGLRDVLWYSSKPDPRQDELRQVAQSNHFSFHDQTEHNPFGLSDSFLLTRQGIHTAKAIEGMSRWLAFALPKYRNVMQRVVGDMTISVFDYHFSRDSDGPDVEQTVFLLSADDLSCQHSALVPASVWDKVTARVSRSVHVQRGYRLTSDLESPLEMTEELVELLDGSVCIEFGEGHLLIYRRGHVVSPALIEFFVKEGMATYDVIADALTASQAEPVLAAT